MSTNATKTIVSSLLSAIILCTVLKNDSAAAAFTPSHHAIAIHHHTQSRVELFLALDDDERQISSNRRHTVNGVECVEVPIELPSLKGRRAVVLEATAESQEDLVNLALEEEGDEKTSEIEKLNAGDPYGAVLWPAAYAIAEKVLGDPVYRSKLHEQTVLELGAGTGLVSMALALAGTKRIIASDYESIPLKLLEYAALNLNPTTTTIIRQTAKETPQQQPLSSISYQLLDIRDYDTPLPRADLVVAADTMYEPKTGKAMAKRAVEALKRGSSVLVGDSPGRPGRQAFLDELKHLGITNAAFVDTIGYTCSGPRHELICGKDSTSVSAVRQEMEVAVMELIPCIHLPKQ